MNNERRREENNQQWIITTNKNKNGDKTQLVKLAVIRVQLVAIKNNWMEIRQESDVENSMDKWVIKR